MSLRALIAIAAAVVVAGLALMLLPSLYEVVDQGRDVRPYDSGSVYEIRLADSITVYAAEESRPDLDAISGSVLVALATAALMMMLLLRTIAGDERLRRFYALAAAGFALLAFDEFFGAHETIGHNLLPLADVPGVERPDDVIFALLAIPAIAFVYLFRDVMFESRRSRWLFGAALVTFGLAAMSDVAGVSADEPLEVITGACILGGFVSLVATHAADALRPLVPTASDGADPESVAGRAGEREQPLATA
jgi:hypothetical protein